MLHGISDSWSEQHRNELSALGLSDWVCTFLCGYRSYHASHYNKGNNLSPSEKAHCGEITGNRIKRLKYPRNTADGHSQLSAVIFLKCPSFVTIQPVFLSK